MPPKASTKSRKRAPENETPAQRFVRLAENRTNQALSALDRLGQCASSKTMEHTPDQAASIVTALKQAVAAVERAFTAPAGTKAQKFAL